MTYLEVFVILGFVLVLYYLHHITRQLAAIEEISIRIRDGVLR
jgi:hypothetical protein